MSRGLFDEYLVGAVPGGQTGKLESMELGFAILAEMQDRMLVPISTDRHDDRLTTFDSALLAAFA